MEIVTADLCDQFADKVKMSVVKPIFKSFGKVTRFGGPIVTVQVLDDNLLIREVIASASPQSVIVVDGLASDHCALFGGNMANQAVGQGLSGIIINGYIRDIVELRDVPLGVIALGSIPFRSTKEGRGQKNTALAFGGVTWQPGDYVYADEDGIIVTTKRLTP